MSTQPTPEWQPIATAPKDGTVFEAIYQDGTTDEICWALERVHPGGSSREAACGEGWATMNEGCRYAPVDEPTHWRPLYEWHNPSNLTDEQVGVKDGWRLCLKTETEHEGCEWFSPGRNSWASDYIYEGESLDPSYTYRTRRPLPESSTEPKAAETDQAPPQDSADGEAVFSWNTDAPPGFCWKCPDCQCYATLGGNAGFHAKTKNHRTPVLMPLPTAPAVAEQEPMTLPAVVSLLRSWGSGIAVPRNLSQCAFAHFHAIADELEATQPAAPVAVGRRECKCTLRERESGHRVDCDYAAESSADGETPETDALLTELHQCLASWAPDARVLGNVRAGDILRALHTIHSERDAARRERDEARAELDAYIKSEAEHTDALAQKSAEALEGINALTAERDEARKQSTIFEEEMDAIRTVRDIARERCKKQEEQLTALTAERDELMRRFTVIGRLIRKALPNICNPEGFPYERTLGIIREHRKLAAERDRLREELDGSERRHEGKDGIIQDLVAANEKIIASASVTDAQRAALAGYVSEYLDRGVRGVWHDLATGIAALMAENKALATAQADIAKLCCVIAAAFAETAKPLNASVEYDTTPTAAERLKKVQEILAAAIDAADHGARDYQAAQAEAAADKRRLDTAERLVIELRRPLGHGSEHIAMCVPEEAVNHMEGENRPSNIRAALDAASATEGGQS